MIRWRKAIKSRFPVNFEKRKASFPLSEQMLSTIAANPNENLLAGVSTSDPRLGFFKFPSACGKER